MHVAASARALKLEVFVRDRLDVEADGCVADGRMHARTPAKLGIVVTTSPTCAQYRETQGAVARNNNNNNHII